MLLMSKYAKEPWVVYGDKFGCATIHLKEA